MEEKERYEVMSPSLNGYAYIHDLKTDNVLNTYDSCDLLNQQSKRIKELQQQLAEKDEQLEYFSKRYDEQEKQLEKQAEFHRKSVLELKQQLNDLLNRTSEKI